KMACPCIALYQSCARVNISEGSCPERIITITGSTESVFRAFTMITYKLEEDLNALVANGTISSKPPVTLRLVIPASQCGSLIGKGGAKIKEIREVRNEMAARNISNMKGTNLLLEMRDESPPKGATIPYRPRVDCTCLPTKGAECMCKSFDASALFSEYLCSLSSGMDTNSQTSQELLIPNDLIGSIIGRQGTKINEIRQVSGAQIKIGSQLDGTSDRHVTITGTPVSINLAQYLITSCLETAKSTAQAATMGSPVDLNMAFTQPTSPTASPAPTLATMGTLTPAHMLGTPYGAMPLSGLLGMKSVPFLTLSSPAPTVAATAAPSHATLAAYTAKISSANCIKKPERQKFAPY
uniref:Poly(rC) binding protein 4 n=1 Tax=Fundulus heteroclitus TaxID=8078 RepID=A0A3Q2Q8J0_FUNHE